MEQKKKERKKKNDYHIKDGSTKEYDSPRSAYEVALDISEGLARAATAAQVNGKTVDLRTTISEDCQLSILTANDKEGLAALRHTTSHVLAEAVKHLFPEAKLAIGPSIETGFYYDFEHASFTREDLDALEKEMKRSSRKVKNWNVSPFPARRPSGLWKKKASHIRWS